jgi:hypothetical protein
VRRRAAAAIATLAALPAWVEAAPADPRETQPFVIGYRCDGGVGVAVAYPAYRNARREPIRLSFQGRRYAMHLTQTGSGAHYVTRDRRLEWWTRGSDEAFLAVPGVSPPILADCKAY